MKTLESLLNLLQPSQRLSLSLSSNIRIQKPTIQPEFLSHSEQIMPLFQPRPNTCRKISHEWTPRYSSRLECLQHIQEPIGLCSHSHSLDLDQIESNVSSLFPLLVTFVSSELDLPPVYLEILRRPSRMTIVQHLSTPDLRSCRRRLLDLGRDLQ